MIPPGSKYESAVAQGSLRAPFTAPVVYIASPIDRAFGADPLTQLRNDSRHALAALDLIIFDPSMAWAVPFNASGRMPLPSAIGAVDFAAVDAADALFALLPDGPPTIGVPIEIERAIARNIPAVIVGGLAAQRSPLLMGRIKIFHVSEFKAAAAYLDDQVRQRLMPAQRPILRVTGDGRIPFRSYPDDCGLDLFTYIDPQIGKTQESIDGSAGSPNYKLHFKDKMGRCVPENFDRAAYRVAPGEFVDIDCGISIELPLGHWGLITGRSSSIRQRNLLVVNGIIDTGYRGRLYMPVVNLGRILQFIEHAERIGQLILMPNATLDVEVRSVDFLSKSERGESGRGSTGK